MSIVQIQRGINLKVYKQELWLLCCARRRVMLYISMKIHENILNGFQVIERTRIYHCRNSKGNNSKKCKDKSYGSGVLHVV